MTDYTINTSFGASYSDISVSSTETSQREVPLPVVPSAPQRDVGENKPVPEKKVPVHNWIFGEIPKIPVLEAVEGIRFDFNYGIRILLPDNAKTYHVAFMDIDTGMTIYSSDAKPGSLVTSTKKFYTNFRLVIHEKGKDEPVFTHDMDLTGKEVMVQLPVGTIGDSIGWFSYVERFQKKHG